jgi:hypothetical protein
MRIFIWQKWACEVLIKIQFRRGYAYMYFDDLFWNWTDNNYLKNSSIKIYIPLVVSTPRSFLNAWLITGFVAGVTWRVPLVEQERFTLSEHLSSPPVFSVIRVARSLVFCIVFYRLLYVPLANVLSDLQFTDIDYPFDVVKLFLREINREKLNFNKYWLVVNIWRKQWSLNE